jgi:hypothetical protein
MAANEAMALGFGGVSLVRRACGLACKTISKGIHEIEEGCTPSEGHVLRLGAGHKPIRVADPHFVDKLEKLIDYQTRGNPESPLRWICKKTRAIADELRQKKHLVSHMKVAQIPHDHNFSLQSNRKTEEGNEHQDRDAQIWHINDEVKKCLRQGMPVISVDTKKKELIGNYHNQGLHWLPAKKLINVQCHDFPKPDAAPAYPYGFYYIGRNTGLVNTEPTTTLGSLLWLPFEDGGAMKRNASIQVRQ